MGSEPPPRSGQRQLTPRGACSRWRTALLVRRYGKLLAPMAPWCAIHVISEAYPVPPKPENIKCMTLLNFRYPNTTKFFKNLQQTELRLLVGCRRQQTQDLVGPQQTELSARTRRDFFPTDGYCFRSAMHWSNHSVWAWRPPTITEAVFLKCLNLQRLHDYEFRACGPDYSMDREDEVLTD